jgi:hypothetical protein
VSSQELSLLSDQEFDSKENGETKREDDSVSAIFDKAKAYEDLCSKLPDVPEIEDPDEVIEQRLRKLKARDETRDTKAGFEKSEDVKNEIHMKVKNNIEKMESRTKSLDEKDISCDKKKADVFDDKTDAMKNVSVRPQVRGWRRLVSWRYPWRPESWLCCAASGGSRS